MRIPNARIPLVCVVLLALLPAAAARANSTDDRILRDCQFSETGALTGSYPRTQLRHALQNLPSDALEYSGCYDAIRQAMIANAGGGHDGGGNGASGGGGTGGGGSAGGGGGATGGGAGATGGTGGGAAPVTNQRPPASAEGPVEVAGTAVTPGTLPELGRDAHALPTPLVVLLALLAAAALAGAALTIGRRVVARRRT